MDPFNEIGMLGEQLRKLLSLVEAAESVRGVVMGDYTTGRLELVDDELAELEPLVQGAMRAMGRVAEVLSGKVNTAKHSERPGDGQAATAQ